MIAAAPFALCVFRNIRTRDTNKTDAAQELDRVRPAPEKLALVRVGRVEFNPRFAVCTINRASRQRGQVPPNSVITMAMLPQTGHPYGDCALVEPKGLMSAAGQRRGSQ